MKRCHWVQTILGALCITVNIKSLAAQDTVTADALCQEGIKLLQAGRYKKACPLLKESLQVDFAAGTLFALADCHAFAGEIATAMQRYEEYLKAVESMPSDKRIKQEKAGRVERVKAQLKTLRLEVPSVTFELTGEWTTGTRVEHDGKELSMESLKVPIEVNPGEHLVQVFIPGKEVRETRYSVAKGERKALKLEGIESASAKKIGQSPQVVVEPKADTESQDESKTSGMRMGAYIAGGIGVLGIGAGAVFGGMVLSGSKDLLARCPKEEGTGKLICRSDADGEALKRSQTHGMVSTVGFALGGAALATGVVLWLMEPKAEEKKVGKLRVDVLGLGSQGAVMGVRGVW